MFTCNATGFPEPRFKWRKDNTYIQYRTGIRYSNEARTLTISGVIESDAGNYTCISTNDHGEMTSPIAKFTVVCKHYFLS